MTDPQATGPRRDVEVGSTRFTLLGTAHVSPSSVEDVRRELASGDYDAVAVELCDSRYRTLTRPDSLEQLDLFQVIRQGKAGMVAASLALGAYQQRLAEQFQIRPGAEMEAAIHGARQADLPLFLIDREIGVTLRRVYRAVPWWQRFTLISGLLASTLSRDRISEQDIERLKEGDLLESTFAEFSQRSEHLYESLIAERDRFMAARLLQEAQQRRPRHVLVVVGAGHLAGLEQALQAPSADPEATVAALNVTPSPARWVRALPWVILALVLVGFGFGFAESPALGLQLLIEWAVITGGLSAVGTVLAAGHPLTVVTAFVTAPLTTLHPLIGVGVFTAAVETALRKPQVRDFRTLRSEVAKLRGWWRNRVARTLLVFILSSVGAAAGTYVAGFRIAGQLLG